MTHFKLISLKKAIQLAILHGNRTKKFSEIDLANSLNFISSKEIRSPINLPELDSAGLDGFIISNKKAAKFPVSSKIIETGNFEDFLFDIIKPSSPAESNSGKFIGERISLLDTKLSESAKSISEVFFGLLLCEIAN